MNLRCSFGQSGISLLTKHDYFIRLPCLYFHACFATLIKIRMDGFDSLHDADSVVVPTRTRTDEMIVPSCAGGTGR